MFAILIILMTFQNPAPGSVIFVENGLLTTPIKAVTHSTITHCAIILYEKNEPWVYEAVPPGVRRVPLKEYLEWIRERQKEKEKKKPTISYFLVEPEAGFSNTEISRMKSYADAQIGKPYRLKNFWRDGDDSKGLHCSQFVGNTIEKSGRIVSKDGRESPGSLYEKVNKIYRKTHE